MKTTLLVLCAALLWPMASVGQSFSLIEQKLTNGSSREWKLESLKMGPNNQCQEGFTLTFTQSQNKAIRKDCVKNTWSPTEFTWSVRTGSPYNILVLRSGRLEKRYELQFVKKRDKNEYLRLRDASDAKVIDTKDYYLK